MDKSLEQVQEDNLWNSGRRVHLAYVGLDMGLIMECGYFHSNPRDLYVGLSNEVTCKKCLAGRAHIWRENNEG